MDSARFDRITRRLSAAHSRRAALGSMLTVAILRQAPSAGAASDRCKANGARCTPKAAGRCCAATCRKKRGAFRCVAAPGAFGCTVRDDACAIPGGPLSGPACGTEPTGRCYLSTFGRPVCAASGNCFDCNGDRDCVEEFGAFGARCVTCDPVCALANPRGRRCVFADPDVGGIPG